MGIALDALVMLEPEMLDEAEDHVRRTIDLLGARSDAVFLHNVTVDSQSGDSRLVPTPLHEGLLDPEVLIRACDDALPEDHPVILSGAAVDAQLAALGSSR